MASQGEREPGGLVLCSYLESMVQDKIPVQDIPRKMLQQSLPQTNPEHEMGVAAAVAYDTSLSLLRNPPPIPAKTAHPSAPDMAQLFAMLAEINNEMDAMEANTQTLRGEMRQMGQCLQVGIMATPRAATNELKGSAPAGKDRVIREMCWASSVKVTEEVTVTVREKLNGVTETCETRHEVTTERIKCIETREIEKIEGRLHDTDGVKDAHTHTRR